MVERRIIMDQSFGVDIAVKGGGEGVEDKFTISLEFHTGDERIGVTIYNSMKKFRWQGLLSVPKAEGLFRLLTKKELSNSEVDAVAQRYGLRPIVQQG
jgi:hypothetical protein